MCSNLTSKTGQFLLLTLNIFHTYFSFSIADFEQVNVSSDI